MPWHQFWKRSTEAEEPKSAASIRSPAATLPPHLQRIVGERKRPERTNPDLQTKLARLERTRLASLYDIEQGELAITVDNPWRQRVELLTEAMATVQADLATAKQVIAGPFLQLPQTPITDALATLEPVATVEFAIGNQRFSYTEDLDWSERGHQLAQSELRLRSGEIERLRPAETDPDLREVLLNHLDESLFVFASDLRDRTIDQEILPIEPTLADLAKPCPICGGWTDWHGGCQNCRQREAILQSLKREENRLLSERDRETEEQHRLKERLPIARRKLREIDAEIEQVRAQI